MVDIDTERNTKIEGDTVTIESQVKEVMTKAEFVNTYQQRNMGIHLIENQLHQFKTKLEQTKELELTEEQGKELEEFKEKLAQATITNESGELIKQIQEAEILLAKKQKDFKNLVPTMEKIKAEVEAAPEIEAEPTPPESEDIPEATDEQEKQIAEAEEKSE